MKLKEYTVKNILAEQKFQNQKIGVEAKKVGLILIPGLVSLFFLSPL